MSSNLGDDRNNGPNGSAMVLLLAIPFIYVFLLGSAVKFYDAFPKPMQQAIETIYLPLELLDGRNPGNPFSRYVDLWDP